MFKKGITRNALRDKGVKPLVPLILDFENSSVIISLF
jgi:hypothetical protein